MNPEQKNEFYYKLWEFHANLLWNRVQYLIVIMAGIYTGWFLLFEEIINNKEHDYLYLFLIIFLCIFGIAICFNFFRLAKRDIEHQQYYEEKLAILFSEIKSDKVKKKSRGRYIFLHLLKLCMVSCVVLGIFSILCFIVK